MHISSKSMTAFLPVRKGSQRIENKNTRKFSRFAGGLLEVKLLQLIGVEQIHEIILSTNDEECLKIGELFNKKYKKIKVIRRPDNLCEDNTNLTDLVEYVPTVCSSDNILWTHVTSPFCNSRDYGRAIVSYYNVVNGNNYDSLMSVKRFNGFLWNRDKNDIVNRVTEQKWPRTQDLAELYEIDNAIFIADRDIFKNMLDRIGRAPFLYQHEAIKSFDIDWEDDFKLAEIIFNGISYEDLF